MNKWINEMAYVEKVMQKEYDQKEKNNRKIGRGEKEDSAKERRKNVSIEE